MKLILLFLISVTVASVVAAADEDAGGSPVYFKEWKMVRMFPVPEGRLEADETEAIKKNEKPEKRFTIAHYGGSGELLSVEEISLGKRKVKFAYVYDKDLVVQIDLFLEDGRQKIYYKRNVAGGDEKAIRGPEKANPR